MKCAASAPVRAALSIAIAMSSAALDAQASHPAAGAEKTPNVRLVAHVPLGGYLRTADVELDQDVARPFAFVSRAYYPPAGFDIVSLKDPAKADVVYSWSIANAEQHRGVGAVRGRLFRSHGREYYVQSFQFAPGTPDADVGAIIFDVTGLPDTTQIKEVARVRSSDAPGGFHSIFLYKHSDGRALMFATASAKPYLVVYDLDKLVAHDGQAEVARIKNPDRLSDSVRTLEGAFHDVWAGFDPATRRDRLYAAGQGGYYVFDVSLPDRAKLLTSVTGVMGIFRGHTVQPSPDGRYLIGGTDYQYSPLRVFDIQPGLDGKAQTISAPDGAWAADWHDMPGNYEVRWPYVFVAALEDGLQIVNVLDPSDPFTVAYYRTYDGPHMAGCCSKDFLADPTKDPKGRGVINGAYGVAVRNADGLIVVSDMTTGLWAFYLDGFAGWNGKRWGVPNVSSAQDWDHPPIVAKPSLVP